MNVRKFLNQITLPHYHSINILLLGDVMLDSYWRGEASRISPEAPVPVVHLEQQEYRAGGAANVAVNLQVLGCKVHLMGIVGLDSAGDQLEQILLDTHIQYHLIRTPDFPTITKTRVLCQNQQLLRLDQEEDFPADLSHQFLQRFNELLPDIDAVILSDYGKNTVGDPRIFIQAANQAGVPVFIDPKRSNFSFYSGAEVVTPNIEEFEDAFGKFSSQKELETLAVQALKDYDLGALLVTQGGDGMTLVTRDQEPLHLPTQAQEIYDVTGAGDTVISIFAASVASGKTMKDSAVLANLAASISVKKLGAATVSMTELRNALRAQGVMTTILLDSAQLENTLRVARERQLRIVMTNGCFDILHAGHIDYLSKAKQMGDRLLVALNDDDSVRRLKGEGRPVNNVMQRAIVLSALSMVDWVVVFSEDTPLTLIEKVKPDVLVKGGDYSVENIVGAEFVQSYGGEVKVIDYVEGISTTLLLNRISKW